YIALESFGIRSETKRPGDAFVDRECSPELPARRTGSPKMLHSHSASKNWRIVTPLSAANHLNFFLFGRLHCSMFPSSPSQITDVHGQVRSLSQWASNRSHLEFRQSK